ncbi:hypothetical protein GCM10011579_088380 [Streptomyces albiflavescens]|uniref:Uncharacterized protein n=1 Tax=Streptomyces albiflavescens TaxID=1623582 RepID=A0A917YDG3_9ACTN|nr:hypothetical protein [Streptomyces albiflavescens]GGN91494.1 hypothetical protein GCM10011579_088380 [Streptomyces albiflavescens]
MNDDELLARLRAADPALTPRAPLPDINRLVEAALNTDITPPSEKTAAGITTRPAKAVAVRRRRRLLTLAAAAGLLMLGGGIAGGIMANGDSGHSSASGPLTLTAASGTAHAKCMAPIPDRLRRYPTLFEGTVTSVKGSSAFFRVDHWLRGGDSDTVRLNSDTNEPESLTFLVGEHYIVAATKDGTVPQCGANMASDETRSKFRQAYGK